MRRRLIKVGSKVAKPKNFRNPTKIKAPKVNTKVQKISTPNPVIRKPKVIGIKTKVNM